MPINPTWTEQEVILAYDLYLRHEKRNLGKKNPDIVTLSEFLRHLPWHADKWQDENFRNTGAVVAKIQQLQAYEAGEQPYSISNVVKEIALTYRHHPKEVHKLADAIRENIGAQLEMLADDSAPHVTEGPEAYAEGRTRFATHKRLERSRLLVNRKLAAVKASTGKLACEVCGFDFEATYGDIGKGFAECHHLVPLSEVGETQSSLSDLAVVCANCHRVLHRRTAQEKLLTVRELQTRLHSK